MPNSMTTQKENPCVKCKGEDETQQVYLCKKCKDLLNSHTCSGGCSNCADIEFEKIYGPTRGPREEGLRIGMLNANSMLRNMDLITALIHSHQFDIFVVVETKLTDEDLDVDVAINDYTKIRFDRPVDDPKDAGGGIIIYYRKCFAVKKESEPINDAVTNVQYIHAKVTHPWKFHLLAIYNPNISSIKTAEDYMTGAYASIGEDKIVMLGDLNKEENVEGIEGLGANQIIEHPTRVTSKTATAIDHIYTNIQIVECGVIRSAISDHDVVFCTVKLPEDAILLRKCFAPDKDINNLFDGTNSNASITKLMNRIHDKTKNMGPIHKSYSTTAAPSDIMAEGIRELARRKIEAIKSRTYELKWRDISKAKDPYQPPEASRKSPPEASRKSPPEASRKSPPEASRKSFIKDFAECSKFLTSSSILSWSKNTGEEVTQEEVKTAIEWVIRYRANKVGRFHEVEELVKEWTSGPVLDALIEGYKSFFAASKPLSASESDNEQPTEEESSVERIIYGVFDYLIAARTEGEADSVMSRGDTLQKLHDVLTKQIQYNGFVFVYFSKCSDTSFKPKLSSHVDHVKFDQYRLKRKSRSGVEFQESPLFQRYLAVKRKELKESPEFKALKDCEMFASADEIAFCMTFTGGLKTKRNEEQMDVMKEKLKTMRDFKKVLSKSVYNKNIFLRIITNALDRGQSGVTFSDNLQAIENTFDQATVYDNAVVTFLGVNINPRFIKSDENKQILQNLETMKSLNKYFASKESSLIDSVRLFTKGKV